MIDTAIILLGNDQEIIPKTPQSLLPIKGKFLIEHIIANLKNNGVKNIIVSAVKQNPQLKDIFQKQKGLNIIYEKENSLLGTGGSVKKALKNINKPFYLIYGDNLTDINLKSMYQRYLEYPTQVVMALVEREDTENFGVVELEEDNVIGFVEKPKRKDAPSKFVSAGVFIINPKCLEQLPEGKSSLEIEVFEKLALLGEINSYFHQGQWFSIDTPEKYSQAQENFK
jgi:NDP-sugar pyrophosphorylase family protein